MSKLRIKAKYKSKPYILCFQGKRYGIGGSIEDDRGFVKEAKQEDLKVIFTQYPLFFDQMAMEKENKAEK